MYSLWITGATASILCGQEVDGTGDRSTVRCFIIGFSEGREAGGLENVFFVDHWRSFIFFLIQRQMGQVIVKRSDVLFFWESRSWRFSDGR